MGHVYARLTGFGMTLIPIWPYPFDRVEHRPGSSSPFLLVGPAGSAIYLQGPYARDRIPPLAQLVGPGQTLVDQQSEAAFDVVELAYEHAGGAWRQSHHLVNLDGEHRLVITAQTPATHGARSGPQPSSWPDR